uniref:Uncharacterized protein n=4 Tax=Parascaris univalens TaxID=6257 RepID=A0A915A4F2_PARUN
GQLAMVGGGSCGGSEDIPCTAQVIEVKQDHAVLCWREAPDQLIYASRDAILTSQRHCENISLRCALKVGDVVSVRVQLTSANSEIRWTALPGTVFFIQHTVLYEGVSKITMDSEEEGHMITERGLVRFQRRRCKYSGPSPNKLPSEVALQNRDLTNHSPRIFSGDQIRFRAISLPDGTWRAVKVSHLFADDISDWRFPHSKGMSYETDCTVLICLVISPSYSVRKGNRSNMTEHHVEQLGASKNQNVRFGIAQK